MIKAKLLNQTAELNDYVELNALNFVPGENLTVAVRIFDAEKNIRYIPPEDAEMTMSFIDKDGNTVEKAATVIDPDDRSMWKVELSQAETEVLAGQNVIIELDVEGDGDQIQIALIANGIIRNNLSGDC